jgi:hypothetical protein
VEKRSVHGVVFATHRYYDAGDDGAPEMDAEDWDAEGD